MLANGQLGTSFYLLRTPRNTSSGAGKDVGIKSEELVKCQDGSEELWWSLVAAPGPSPLPRCLDPCVFGYFYTHYTSTPRPGVTGPDVGRGGPNTAAPHHSSWHAGGRSDVGHVVEATRAGRPDHPNPPREHGTHPEHSEEGQCTAPPKVGACT